MDEEVGAISKGLSLLSWPRSATFLSPDT